SSKVGNIRYPYPILNDTCPGTFIFNKPSLNLSGFMEQKTVILASDITDNFTVRTSNGNMVDQSPPKNKDTINKYPTSPNNPKHKMKIINGLTFAIVVVTTINTSIPINIGGW